MKTKLTFLILSIAFILLIARESLGWAIIACIFLLILGCWLNTEPRQYKSITGQARMQNELINTKNE